MHVSLLTIGDEILIGQVVDTNSAWMGQQLNLSGYRVNSIYSVGDTLEAIQNGIRQAFGSADIALVTGGLGPTKDDITKTALADFFGTELVFHAPTFERIARIFEKFNRPVQEAHRLQAMLPANAEVLPNKMGTAPGLWIEHNGKVLVSMPGVPYEMQYLVEHEVLPRLKTRFPGMPIAHRTLLTVGEGESILADRISDWEDRLPSQLKLAYLPGIGQVRLRLTGTDPNEERLHALLDQKAAELAELVQDCLYGTGQDQIQAAVGRMLQARGLRLATAESCTGGHISHLITSVPGASAYFEGAVIAYSNAAKTTLLGVSPQLIEKYGAVSEACVQEMATGVLRAIPANIAIAISGIAGPGGGTPDKPVGTIWMAVSDGRHTETQKIHAGKDRLKNIQFSSVQALNLLRMFLIRHYPVHP
jgi:nicotinamide-nucleotide amidase